MIVNRELTNIVLQHFSDFGFGAVEKAGVWFWWEPMVDRHFPSIPIRKAGDFYTYEHKH